jgi:16S rRNA processing protein RimM
MKEQEKRVCVAQVGAAHGLKGEVRLKSFTEQPEAVARYGALQTEDGAREIEIVALRPGKDGLIAKFADVNDRNAAEALRNVRLYVPRVRLPQTEDDTFYYADLIGLAAATAEGETIGEVVAVHNFGAGDILEIRLAARDDTVMLPFTDATVPAVEIAAGRIVVAPPEGMLEPSVSPRPSAAESRKSPPPLRGRPAGGAKRRRPGGG